MPNTLYTATITTGAQDLAGTALASNYVWTFTTAVAIVVVPPTVIATVLRGGNGCSAQPDCQRHVQHGDEPGHDQLDNLHAHRTRRDSSTRPGCIRSGWNTLTFTPTANLIASTLYTGTITTGVQDLAGTPMAHQFMWTSQPELLLW